MEVSNKTTDFTAVGKAAGYPEVDHIRNDLRALKTDTAELGRRIASDGREKINEIAETATAKARDEYDHLSTVTKEKSQALESYIKEHPLRGAAAAFLTGFVVSMAMRKH